MVFYGIKYRQEPQIYRYKHHPILDQKAQEIEAIDR